MPGCDEGQLAEAENRLGKRLPASVRSLYIGDDGTGDPFCVRLDDGARIARWSCIARAVVEEMTFEEFESEWLPASAELPYWARIERPMVKT